MNTISAILLTNRQVDRLKEKKKFQEHLKLCSEIDYVANFFTLKKVY